MSPKAPEIWNCNLAVISVSNEFLMAFVSKIIFGFRLQAYGSNFISYV
jgi:hypothetical protein